MITVPKAVEGCIEWRKFNCKEEVPTKINDTGKMKQGEAL
jgi:hypothetical protein